MFYCCRSQWPSGLRHGSTAGHLVWMCIWILLGSWLSVSCECGVSHWVWLQSHIKRGGHAPKTGQNTTWKIILLCQKLHMASFRKKVISYMACRTWVKQSWGGSSLLCLKYKLGFQLTVRHNHYMLFLFICQSDYMFRPSLGHHQVTSTSYNRGS